MQPGYRVWRKKEFKKKMNTFRKKERERNKYKLFSLSIQYSFVNRPKKKRVKKQIINKRKQQKIEIFSILSKLFFHLK